MYDLWMLFVYAGAAWDTCVGALKLLSVFVNGKFGNEYKIRVLLS